jgi:hypothetical protein
LFRSIAARRVDLAIGDGIENMQAQSHGAHGRLRILDLALRQGAVGIDEDSEIARPGRDLVQQLQPLGRQRDADEGGR